MGTVRVGCDARKHLLRSPQLACVIGAALPLLCLGVKKRTMCLDSGPACCKTRSSTEYDL